MVQYTFRCTRCNFLSETNRICNDVSLASWCSSSINRYSGSCPFPCARLLRLLCQPSTSLFVLTAWRYTLQLDGGHMVLLIHVVSTYSTNCWRGSVVACTLRRLKIGIISLSGRKGNAITILRKRYVPRSLV